MKIGLVRHFKISASISKAFMNSREFAIWAKKYEDSGVERGDIIEVLTHWPKCICSSSTRTVETATLLYGHNIEKMDLIREVPIGPVFETRIRLPFLFWLIFGRIAWLFCHRSQPESAKETIKRVKTFIENSNLIL